MAGGPPQAQLNPTSAARPVLADLKAVSAETEGAVSCHDAAIAAPELVAGRQKLYRGKEKREGVKIKEKGYESFGVEWEITF